jgi:hypothetical protein
MQVVEDIAGNSGIFFLSKTDKSPRRKTQKTAPPGPHKKHAKQQSEKQSVFIQMTRLDAGES